MVPNAAAIAHRLLVQPESHHVGKGVFADGAQALRDEEEHQRPPDEEARRVEQAVEAALGDQARDAQKARGAHVIARQREAVLPGR